jgi:hypothetical protein
MVNSPSTSSSSTAAVRNRGRDRRSEEQVEVGHGRDSRRWWHGRSLPDCPRGAEDPPPGHEKSRRAVGSTTCQTVLHRVEPGCVGDSRWGFGAHEPEGIGARITIGGSIITVIAIARWRIRIAGG